MPSSKQLNWRTLLSIAGGVIVLTGFAQIVIFLLFPTPFPTGKFIVASSPAGSFSITYPEFWHFSETPRGHYGFGGFDSSIVAVVGYNNFPKIGRIVTVNVRRSTILYNSLGEVSDWGNQLASKNQAYKSVQPQKSILSDEETILREYVFDLPATPIQSPVTMRCYDNYRLHEQVGYILTLCVNVEDFDTVGPIFQQMIASFVYRARLEPKPSTATVNDDTNPYIVYVFGFVLSFIPILLGSFFLRKGYRYLNRTMTKQNTGLFARGYNTIGCTNFLFLGLWFIAVGLLGLYFTGQAIIALVWR